MTDNRTTLRRTGPANHANGRESRDKLIYCKTHPIRDNSRHSRATRLSFAILLLTLLTALPCFAADDIKEPPTVRGRQLEVVLRSDFDGLAAIRDRDSGRNYAAQQAEASGLYRLGFANDDGKTTWLSSRDAARRKATPIDGGWQLQFEHQSDWRLVVTCRVTATADGPVRWAIRVESRSDRPLTTVAYPRAVCPLQLGDDSTDDRVLYPSMEGVLLCDPARHFRPGTSVRNHYPGTLAAQLAYYFDPAGGFYTAAADASGAAKNLAVARDGETLVLTWEHRFPEQPARQIDVPYEVVWDCAAGRWEAGAELYRRWAADQPWCAKKIPQRDTPAWLRRANVLLNFSVRDQSSFQPAATAAKTFARYRELLGTRLIGTPFGWEKNGTWIGPDYFPPYGGEAYYRELSGELAQHGDHILSFTSGFRWGVRKPVTERRGVPRRYTDYDGTAQFDAQGKPLATVRRDGSLDFRKLPWADNYTLCVGSAEARRLLADCYRALFGMGIAGVDLDQNLGGAASECFSTDHGHPPGSGLWQSQAMTRFLDDVRRDARRTSPDAFMGVEEPCEFYIPQLDMYHGRAFTDTHWPATGPGAVAVPLYVYLYHEYQLGYAGWCDSGFSPFGDERVGLARAFLFGMQPGVRVSGGPFALVGGKQPSESMQLLVRTARLTDRMRDYLLLGRMLPSPRVTGAARLEGKSGPRRPKLPVEWSTVQATAWRSAAGGVCYAVANLSPTPQKVRLDATADGSEPGPVTLTRISAEGDPRRLAGSTELPINVALDLGPWEVCCIEQTLAAKE